MVEPQQNIRTHVLTKLRFNGSDASHAHTSTANVNACSRCPTISHPAAVSAIECDRAKLKAQEQQSIDAAQSFL